MQKQSEGTGLFALGMWPFKGIMVKVYVSSINEMDLPFRLPVFLHVKRKMWQHWKAADSTVIKMKVFFMQSGTGLWNPFQQEAAEPKNLARASVDLDVLMKNMCT